MVEQATARRRGHRIRDPEVLELEANVLKDLPKTKEGHRTAHAAEAIRFGADLREGGDTVAHIGATTRAEGDDRLNPRISRELGTAARNSTADHMLKGTPQMPRRILPGAKDRVEERLHNLASDMETGRSVYKLDRDLEQIQKAVDEAVGDDRQIFSELGKRGVPEEAQGRVLFDLGVAAHVAAEKTGRDGRPADPNEMLKDTLKAFAHGGDPNEHSRMVMLQFMSEKQVRQEHPDLVKWMEHLLSEEAKPTFK